MANIIDVWNLKIDNKAGDGDCLFTSVAFEGYSVVAIAQSSVQLRIGRVGWKARAVLPKSHLESK